jgi:hypothetical protein
MARDSKKITDACSNQFGEIFNAYKGRNRRAGEDSFKNMEWSRQYVKPGQLGFSTTSSERVTRYEWVRTWAHLHPKIKVVGELVTRASFVVKHRLIEIRCLRYCWLGRDFRMGPTAGRRREVACY